MEFLKTNYKNLLKILLIFLVLGLIGYIFAYVQDNNPDISSVEITNLSSNSVSISWASDDIYIGSIQYSKDDNWLPFVDKLLPKNQVYDDRDVVKDSNENYIYSSSIAFPRNFHQVTIRNLEPETKYYFRINGNLRTFVPTGNSITTTAQLETVDEPDPIYGNVVNYNRIADTPFDGIVFYRLVNNTDMNDFSKTYSSTVSRDATWSGDLSNILNKDGQIFKWDKSKYSVELRSKTSDGEGLNTYAMSDYRPTGDSIVNVRYFPTEEVIISTSVLGLSTDMAREDDTKPPSATNPVTPKKATPGATSTSTVSTTGKTTTIKTTNNQTVTIPTTVANNYGTQVTNVFGNSAIVVKNGVSTPICTSSYSEACAPGCNRSVTCGGGGEFITGSCNCPTTNINGTVTTKPIAKTEPSCPVATIYSPATGKCEATAVGSDKETKTQPPAAGASDLVALRPGETPATQQTRNEAGAKGLVAQPTTNLPNIVSACANGANTGKKDMKAGVECNCQFLNSRVPDGNGGKYICRDPAKGWEPLESTSNCPTTYGCSKLSCGSGTYSTENGVPYCSYGSNSKANIGNCANGAITNKVSDAALELSACGSLGNPTVLNSCKARLEAETCPTFTDFGCGRSRYTLTPTKRVIGNSIVCEYSFAGVPYTLEKASCSASGVFTPRNIDIRGQVCSTDRANNSYTDQPLIPSDGTNVQVKCNIDQERRGATISGCFDSSSEGNTSPCIGNFGSNPIKWCKNAPTNTNTPTTETTTPENYSPVTDTQTNQLGNLGYCTATDCKPNSEAGYNACKDVGTGATQYCKNISPANGGGSNSPSPCPTGVDGKGDNISCQLQEDSTHTKRCLSNEGPGYKYCVEGTQGSIFNLSKKVYAQPIPDVIDPVLLSKGTYRIEVPGYQNAEFSILNNNVSVKYFKDDNADGIRQDSETYIDPSAYQISVAKISDLTTYNLQTGWNLIALNFIALDLDQASELAKSMNEQGVSVVQISKYDNGNWIHYVYRVTDAGETQNFGNDFKLVPGEGYFVRSLTPGIISLKGQKFTSSVPLQLNIGWNLESIQSTTKYTATSLMDKCKEQGVSCTTVSRFEDNVYESVVDFEGKIFGNSFNLEDTRGYFVLNKGPSKVISP